MGYRLFGARQFEEAARAFEKAWSLSPEPRFLLNLGVTWTEAEGRCVEAFAAFERFFAACADCELASEGARRHRGLIGKCSWSVIVESAPPGASVRIDGNAVGETPVEQALRAGRHEVEASLPGHAPVSQTVEVTRGVAQKVLLTFTPEVVPPQVVEAPPPPPPDRTWVWVASGVATAGAVVGGTFGVMLISDLDRESSAGDLDTLNDARSDARRDAVLTQVGLGVALTGVVAAALLWE